MFDQLKISIHSLIGCCNNNADNDDDADNVNNDSNATISQLPGPLRFTDNTKSV